MNAASVALIVVLIVAVPPWHPPEVAGLGTIVRGSIVHTGPWEHHITLEDTFALDRGWPSGETIDVRVFGELPGTVCDGTRVHVSGMKTAKGLVATAVLVAPGRYDGCFQWHCHPDAYKACLGGHYP